MQFTRLKLRLGASFLIIVALVAAMGWYAAQRLRDISASLDTIYEDRIVCIQQLRILVGAYGPRIQDAVALKLDGDLSSTSAVQRIEDAQRDGKLQWNNYKKTYLTPQESQLVALAEPALLSADAAANKLKTLLASPDTTGLNKVASNYGRSSFAELSSFVEQLIALQLDVARLEVARGKATYNSALWAISVSVALAVVIGALLVWNVLVRYGEEERAHALKLTRLNNFYQALSQTNQLIVRVHDPEHLLREICRICVEHGHALVACVSLTDRHTATRFATAGPASTMFAGLPPTWDLHSQETRSSVVSTAILDGVHAISQDYQREVPLAAWRENAVKAGVRSAACFPLRRAGQVVGALALYASDVGFFDESLVRLLDEMAEDVSYALDNIEREAARSREQQLTAEGLENFRAAFQGSPVSSVVAEVDTGVVLEANDTFCERYGVTREEMVGHTMFELGLGMLREDSEKYRAVTLREGRVRNLEVRTRVRGGATATVVANAEMIQYKGRPCMLSMTMDVTDLRRAATAREAQFEAEAANRAKNNFLSRMSHELRTPLNAMLGFAQLMRIDARDRLSLHDLAQLDHIHQAGWHLVSLVNDVLDVSRIESGSLDVQPRALSLGGILDEALQMSGPMSEQAGVSLGAAYRNLGPIGVSADPVRLKQVFINLLSNAIKYNRPGGSVHVEVHTSGNRVTVEVVDTGLGMTGEQMEHLYEPFNRLGRERGGIEGTGLGLSLTRQLVRQMEGELDIQSHVGRGTTARVSLRSAEVPNLDDRTSEEVQAAEFRSEPKGVVLYIEDNEVNVMVVEQMLARWSGVRFVHAPDGRTGIGQARLLKPDLVLLDMQLPDMNGFEVLSELRRHEATSKLFVTALSASAMDEDVRRALADGAQDYWTKPLNLQQFLRNVAGVLARNAALA